MTAIDSLTVKLARVKAHWRITPGGKKIWVRAYDDSRDRAAVPEAMGIHAKKATSATEKAAQAQAAPQAPKTPPAPKAAPAPKMPPKPQNTEPNGNAPKPLNQPARGQLARDARGTHYDRAKEVLTRANEFEPQLTNALKTIVGDNGGNMAGLEFRLKTEDSLARKIRDKAKAKKMTEDQYAQEIGDAVRYTALYDPADYVQRAEATLKALESQGHTVIDVENNWARGDAYSGVNAVLQAENGMRWELQFHTEDSLVAKERAHEFYDTVRDPSKPKEERSNAYSRSTAQWEDVPQPKGWEGFGKQIFRPEPDLFDPAAFQDEKAIAKQRLDDARKERLKKAAKAARQKVDAERIAASRT